MDDRINKEDGLEEGVVTMTASLSVKVIRADGTEEDKGIQSRKKVTAAFAKFLTDGLAAGTMDPMKYHASGTDATAEANTQTALLAEVESRVVGSQVSATSGNNATYTSVGTVTYTGAVTVNEHGVLSASTGGTLMDRSKLTTGQPVAIGDKIQFTYILTINSEA